MFLQLFNNIKIAYGINIFWILFCKEGHFHAPPLLLFLFLGSYKAVNMNNMIIEPLNLLYWVDTGGTCTPSSCETPQQL